MNIIVFSEINASMFSEEGVKAYPETLGVCLKNLFEENGNNVTLVKLDENGAEDFNQDALNTADVAVWWAHWYHGKVQDELVDKIIERVQKGMGLICLHSAHKSKVFMKLNGTSGSLKWREVGEFERLWNIAPYHPIAQGIGEYFEIPHEEMYGERFDIPEDGKIIFISNFEGGNVFRSGVAFDRGYGKVFYFQPGHESYPTYHQKEVIQVIANAVRWAKPAFFREMTAPNYPAIDEVKSKYEGDQVGVVQNADGSNK